MTEYLSHKRLLELRLIRYYVELNHEIETVNYTLNNFETITSNHIFENIKILDSLTRKIIEKAGLHDNDEYILIFEENKSLFCNYANNIIENLKDLCKNIEGFYKYIQNYFIKEPERYRQLKIEYDKLLQSILVRMMTFLESINEKYKNDCIFIIEPEIDNRDGAKTPSRIRRY